MMPDLSRSLVCPAVVLGVHDGDSLTLAVTGFPAWVCAARLKAVHAVEIGTTGAGAARANLMRLAQLGGNVRVQFSLTKEGHVIQSLCRPVVEIWSEKTGANINESQANYLKSNNWWGGKEPPLDPASKSQDVPP